MLTGKINVLSYFYVVMNYLLIMKRRVFLMKTGMFFLCFISLMVASHSQTVNPKYEFRGVWVATVNQHRLAFATGINYRRTKKRSD